MSTYLNLGDDQKDVLKELGNIGTGHALTALASLIDKRIEAGLPTLQIVKYQDVPDLLGGAETLETGVMMETQGLNGMFLFLMNEEFTKRLLNFILGEEPENVWQIGEMESSAVCEAGNIMCSSYITALSRMLDMEIQMSVPDICVDMAGAILSVPMIHFANIGNEILLIENQFYLEHVSFVCHILFLPEPEALDKIFTHLGVDMEERPVTHDTESVSPKV